MPLITIFLIPPVNKTMVTKRKLNNVDFILIHIFIFIFRTWLKLNPATLWTTPEPTSPTKLQPRGVLGPWGKITPCVIMCLYSVS